jgi:hypothetical protein
MIKSLDLNNPEHMRVLYAVRTLFPKAIKRWQKMALKILNSKL